ncbi:MAG TPA: methyltransferase domain-containing protein [Spirochaetota bacterium]|nr:methyltransferase domain-containing protein [Spirochaetota bacterium]
MHNSKRDFDLAALTWDEKPQRLQLNRDIFRAIDQTVQLTDGISVLDFGCGTGLLSLQILERTGSVTCADSSAGMLEVLESKVKDAGIDGVTTIHLKSDDAEGLTGSYALITSSMTFHHVQDVPQLVKKLAGHLESGGTLCAADLDPDEGKFHEDNTGVHHYGFTRKKMMEYFRDAGLADVKATTAAAVERMNAAGEQVSFTVFLVTGTKPAER